jgi:hypothetical protein
MNLDRSRIVWKLCLYALVAFCLMVVLFPKNITIQGLAFLGFLVVLGWGLYMNAFVYMDARLEGFANLFRKKLSCENCGILTPKAQLGTFDSFLRAERSHGEKMDVCQSCLLNKLREYLDAYKFRAVVVYPVHSGNAYHFYSDKSLHHYHFEPEWIDNILKFLPPPDASCEACHQPAHFNWCSSEIYYNEPALGSINLEDKFPHEYLCSECVDQKFREYVRREGIYFEELLPPVDADGVCMSGDI